MDGHVIAFKSDDSKAPITYWDGNTETAELDLSLLIENKVTARQTAGTLQSQYTDREVLVLPASKGIQLKQSDVSSAAR